MKILTIGNDLLRSENSEVNLEYIKKEEFKNTIKDMKNSMNKNNGIGLAAPQVGINKKFFIIRFPNNKFDINEGFGKIKIIINPKIIEKSKDKKSTEEGCLSIPGVFAKVKRPSWIIAEWIDENNITYKQKLEGYDAVVFQHEYDHLDGVLFTDYLSKTESKSKKEIEYKTL